jgi:hypothetical protein
MTFSNTSEIHISGRIDNFLFGAMKDPYFQEFQNANQVFKDSSKTKQDFLESFFSLFLENNPFENKTNLEIFNENIDVNKLQKLCPHFYKIYQTVLPESLESKEIVNKDGEAYLKTENIRSTEYDHYSFLEEILDSPSHLSQNTNPEVDNQFRVFSPELWVEVYSEGKKIHEGELGKFLDLKIKNVQDQIMNTEEENNLLTDKQKKALANLEENKYSYLTPNMIAASKRKIVHFENFWPIDFFKFTMGTSSKLLDQKYWWQNMDKHYQYEFTREVRVTFSNVSKCIFKFPEKIDFEKLLLLRCGSDEGCRQEAINYDDDTNLFNFVAYDGKIIKPEETIFRDKGIDILLSSEISQYNQQLFFVLFID